MPNFDVEIYGIPPGITSLHRVQIDLKDEPNTGSLLAGLKAMIPALAGTVIDSKTDELMEGFTLNIDGQFYRRGMNKKLAGGEHIVLLALASGG